MAKKSRPKKSASKAAAKGKVSAKPKASGIVGVAAKAVSAVSNIGGLGIIGGKKAKGFRRSKKRSALWYAKEVQRLRLKRKWQKEKMRL